MLRNRTILLLDFPAMKQAVTFALVAVWGRSLPLIAVILVLAASALVAELWHGARPEVRSFGSDLAAKWLDAARRTLGIPVRGDD
jgi:hypothetical protein